MAKRQTLKQTFIATMEMLQLKCASDGSQHRHHISQPLCDAMKEIVAELERPRTNWKLVAALTGVKSFIINRAKEPDGNVNHFWSRISRDGPYTVLDDLHHRACLHIGKLPSGMMTVFTGTPSGIVMESGEVDTLASSDSPTLRLIAEERAGIKIREEPHMNQPLITIVGTPDLPEGIREMFGDTLLPSHEMFEVDSHLFGYRIAHSQDGVSCLSNVLVGDDGETYTEDDRQEAISTPSTFVPCRLDYYVCPECLRTIRAHAFIIEGESEEDRAHPSIEDAWDQVEGSGRLCGVYRCENPPQEVTFTNPEGVVSVRTYPSTRIATMAIGCIVQKDPEVDRPENWSLDADEIVDLYEQIGTHLSGTFVRRDLDPKMA